jgi:hypothetical protein
VGAGRGGARRAPVGPRRVDERARLLRERARPLDRGRGVAGARSPRSRPAAPRSGRRPRSPPRCAAAAPAPSRLRLRESSPPRGKGEESF